MSTDIKSDVRTMFNSIAWRYDFLNHFLSFNIDRLWRKRAISLISKQKDNPEILDVATGTADLAIAAMKINPVRVVGIDISEKMLEIGRQKILKKGFTKKIQLMHGDSEAISFKEGSFDVAMVAFGVRNFANPLAGLSEMRRVLRPDGMIMVLEFSKPSGFFFGPLYNFYFGRILPVFGKIFSKDRKAYDYLHDSVMKFPEDAEFLRMLSLAGFKNTAQIRLTGGIASIYTGKS